MRHRYGLACLEIYSCATCVRNKENVVNEIFNPNQ